MFPNTQTQPLFPLPRYPIVSIADRTSLAMVPRAASTLESSPNSAPQLPNPPPSPTCVESPSIAASSVPNNSFDDVMSQLMNQLGHEIDIMNSYQIITNPSLTPISCALAQSAMEKNRTPVEEEKYEEYTAQSPLHQDVDRASAAWVILHRGIIGRPLSQYSGNLKPGIFVRLDDTTLAKRYCGFEQPMLFAELGRALHRERGYHFFGSIPHLCVITGEFHPLDLTRVITLIAIPDALVDDTAKLDSPIRLDSINQMVTSDESFVYPPLREWEKNPVWKHPEWYKIEQWMRGERPDLPQVWSEFLSKV